MAPIDTVPSEQAALTVPHGGNKKYAARVAHSFSHFEKTVYQLLSRTYVDSKSYQLQGSTPDRHLDQTGQRTRAGLVRSGVIYFRFGR